MNGADLLLSTLAANGVDTCFANPGTSEMQFVAALDRAPAMRSVLCLFEGVATGAADGYGRMAEKPACTLLHLGPGYGNGVANLHNARKAFTPVINIIGDHATYHRQFDAPLHSDIATLAAPNSLWVKSADRADDIAALTADAVSASLTPPCGPVSLILPADSAWSETMALPMIGKRPGRALPPDAAIDEAARIVKEARNPVLILGGQACRPAGLALAARLAALGIRVLSDTFVARQSRGAGVFAPDRLEYFAELALQQLSGVDAMILAGTAAPVAFFAYPDRPGTIAPPGCVLHTLAERSEDAVLALAALADRLGARNTGTVQPLRRPDMPPSGPLTAELCGRSISRHLPEGTVVCDDAVTSGAAVAAACRTTAPHEHLALTGGSIGIAVPLAIGAAIAKPDRKILALSGDGAAMYTLQALWTIARAELDITVLIFANGVYRILDIEMERTGAGAPGPDAAKLLSLTEPEIRWCSLAEGMGIPAVRCRSGEEFEKAFSAAMAERGPRLIEAVIA